MLKGVCVCTLVVSYDHHKVSLGCRSTQPAAIEATSPLSHEMTWQAAQRAAHNIESMMLILHTRKTPRKMLTQHQHVPLSRDTHRMDKIIKNGISVIQQSSGLISLSILLFLPSFIFNGDRGTDGESSYPAAPLPHLLPSLMFVS